MSISSCWKTSSRAGGVRYPIETIRSPTTTPSGGDVQRISACRFGSFGVKKNRDGSIASVGSSPKSPQLGSQTKTRCSWESEMAGSCTGTLGYREPAAGIQSSTPIVVCSCRSWIAPSCLTVRSTSRSVRVVGPPPRGKQISPSGR